jgi:hypothetical protein
LNNTHFIKMNNRYLELNLIFTLKMGNLTIIA